MTTTTSITGGEACLQATRALCNVCGKLTEAKVVQRSNTVHLVKWCPEHGMTEALVSSDADWYLRSLSYVKPATVPRSRAVLEHTGCPTSCGLCPEHQQHTCVPLLEITGACDMECPICLVGDPAPRHIALDDVARMIDALVEREGTINMVTLSGGEPTTHPRLLEIVDLLRRPEIGIISLSTNGLRLASDERLLDSLRERGVVVSLQLDGFDPGTYEALRGRADLAVVKRSLLDRLCGAGIRTSLTMTLARGVNEGEIPAVLDTLFSNDNVVSMMVQPLAHAGRAAAVASRGEPLTIPDVVRLLADGSKGILEPGDITPLPCSHPSCFALTYLLKTERRGLVPLPRILERDAYLEIVKNQALLDTSPDGLERARDALYSLWSSSGLVPDAEAVLGSVKQLLLELNRLGRGASHADVLALGVKRVKSIFIHAFMDRRTFDLSRAIKCCNHYPQPDGRFLPACVRNNLMLDRRPSQG